MNELIAVSFPFVFAIVLQVLRTSTPAYAKFLLNSSLAGRTPTSDRTKDLVIDLAVLINTHLSFVLGVLTASVSCVAFTITSQKRFLAAVGAVALFAIIPLWIFKWQPLTTDELSGKRGRPMRILNWATITVLWAITLYARLNQTSTNP
jgi:hypothetical protein